MLQLRWMGLGGERQHLSPRRSLFVEMRALVLWFILMHLQGSSSIGLQKINHDGRQAMCDQNREALPRGRPVRG